MKKTFLAMLLLGGTMSMFAQTTGTGSTTTQGNNSSTTNSSTTNPTMGTTNNSRSTTNGSTMSGTNTTTNGTWNNGNTTSGSVNGTTGNMNSTSNNSASWNGVSNPSTSWTPETAPSYGWNSYGIWNNYGMNNGSTMSGSNSTANSSMNNGSSMNNSSNMSNSTTANGNMSSANSYSAYSGTAVSSLPANIQYHFNQDFPAGVNNQYSWNQYGDWFHTYYMNNGRLTQYFYDQRGNGYSLALPVLETYVPENIVSSALQKYGSQLYSIAMVKTNNGQNAYQIGLLQGGQMNMQYLDENGATVADVWRVENMNNGSMNSTQSNAAMDNSGSMSNSSSSSSMDNSSSTSSDSMSGQSGSDSNNQSSDNGKTKLKIKHADGSIDKIKTKNGHTKVKTIPATDNTNNQQ
jgi:hypothetical protein